GGSSDCSCPNRGGHPDRPNAVQSACREWGGGTGDHRKDRGMIELAEKPSSGCIGGEVVGCRAAEHREKASGIDTPASLADCRFATTRSSPIALRDQAPSGRARRSGVCLIHRFNLRDTGRNFHSCATAVFSKQRSTSATLQAWAMQPRGVNGGSTSKTSLIEPMPASARCGSKPSRKCRAIAGSLG